MSVSARDPDWSREGIRQYQAAGQGVIGTLTRKYWALQRRFWSTVTQAKIHLTQPIGGGLLLPHPNGIVMHLDSVIGPNCLIFQQVTLGTVPSRPGAPVLGGHVDVGATGRDCNWRACTDRVR